jgi:hypothetical protein
MGCRIRNSEGTIQKAVGRGDVGGSKDISMSLVGRATDFLTTCRLTPYFLIILGGCAAYSNRAQGETSRPKGEFCWQAPELTTQ